jgi:exoribonuclease R
MILANICSAKLMFQNQINGIFRAHDSEDERAYYTLLKKYHT